MKKIALIGIGKMGLSHLAIANQTPRLTVEAICDTSKTFIRLIKKNTKFNCFTDYKKMISEVELDGVMVLTPNSTHFEIVKYCIEKKLHVFVEKPLSVSLQQSKTLVDLTKQYNTKGQVGYVNRFNPIFRKLKKLLEAKVIGEPASYINKMVGGVILKQNNKGWRNDYSKGGGCLLDYGPHCFDLAVYLFGDNIEISGPALKKVYSTNVDDVVSVTLIHDRSISGLNFINWSDSSVRKATNSIEIYGSKGKIVANKQELSIYLDQENDALDLSDGWNQIYVTDEDLSVPYYLRGEDFSRQLLSFSELLNNENKKSEVSFETAAVTDGIIEKIKNSKTELL